MKKKIYIVEGDYNISNNIIDICPNCGASTLLIEEDGELLCFSCKHIAPKSEFETAVAGFAFNDCDVCLNPELFFKYDKCTIQFCYDGEKWSYGLNDFTGGGLPSLINCKYTREEVEKESIQRLKEMLKIVIKSDDKLNYPEKIKKIAKQAMRKLIVCEYPVKRIDLDVRMTQNNIQYSLLLGED